MKSQNAKILVVQSQALADELNARFLAAAIETMPLSADMLHLEAGQAMFPGREAGLICLLNSEEDARRVDEICRGSSIDILKFDQTLQIPSRRAAGRLVPVFVTSQPFEANLLKTELARHEIEAVLSNEAVLDSPTALVPGQTAVKLLVAEHDEQAAREILAAISPLADDPYDEQPEDFDDADPAWPTCPDCSARRITACPICQTSGTSFPRADANFLGDQADENQLAVICTTCDEPWIPIFLRRCEWCGHDFGEGLVLETDEPDPLEDQFNRRAAILFFSLSFLLLAILIWFKYVGR